MKSQGLYKYITHGVRGDFRHTCMTLLGEAYLNFLSDGGCEISWNEENITARIVDYISKSELAELQMISVVPEYRLPDPDISSNRKPAKTALRIDLRLSSWNFGSKEWDFYVEAKNLIENNCQKTGNKTKLNATAIKRRYINTGIDNFVSGKYPLNGCLIGYVLEGNPDNIAKDINGYLKESGREPELLKKYESGVRGLEIAFLSKHPDEITLQHFFFDFASV